MPWWDSHRTERTHIIRLLVSLHDTTDSLFFTLHKSQARPTLLLFTLFCFGRSLLFSSRDDMMVRRRVQREEELGVSYGKRLQHKLAGAGVGKDEFA